MVKAAVLKIESTKEKVLKPVFSPITKTSKINLEPFQNLKTAIQKLKSEKSNSYVSQNYFPDTQIPHILSQYKTYVIDSLTAVIEEIKKPLPANQQTANVPENMLTDVLYFFNADPFIEELKKESLNLSTDLNMNSKDPVAMEVIMEVQKDLTKQFDAFLKLIFDRIHVFIDPRKKEVEIKIKEFLKQHPTFNGLQYQAFLVPLLQNQLDQLKKSMEPVVPQKATVTPIVAVKKKRSKTPVRSRSRSRPRDLKVVEEGPTLIGGGACACGRR